MTIDEGKLIVVSGPSGAGKTTVLRRLFEHRDLPLVQSVSATTRPPRQGKQGDEGMQGESSKQGGDGKQRERGEVDGVDYHFLTPEQFDQHRRNGDFLECFEVFGKGHWYGTLNAEVASGLERGKWVVLEIDVQGAHAVVERYPDAITIFIWPGSLDELEKRLRGRHTETEQAVRRRLDRAREELALAHRYQHKVINDDVDHAVRQIHDILTASGG